VSVVTGKPGTVYRCEVHGDFVPEVLPRHERGQPEAKCRVWAPDGYTFCGRYCPPAPRPSLIASVRAGIRELSAVARAMLEPDRADRGSPWGDRAPVAPAPAPGPAPGLEVCPSCATWQRPGAVHYASLAAQRPCPASWARSKAAP
jgi:hypothetical protein